MSAIRSPQDSAHIFLKTPTSSSAISSDGILPICSKGLKATVSFGLVGSIKTMSSLKSLPVPCLVR